MNFRNIIIILISLVSAVVGNDVSAQSQKGNATYYGHKFHGRRTSDGSRYHRDSLTCAHRTLPFGTFVKVRNLKNNKEVVVKVTDRGPFRRGAIIDLSYAAAEEIGMVSSGVQPVEIAQVSGPDALNGNGKYDVGIPEIQLADPVAGKYYTLKDLREQAPADRELARQEAARHLHPSYLNTIQKEIRYKVLEEERLANAGKVQVKGKRK